MLTDENFKDLDVKGYTVVPNVATSRECDMAINEYRRWLRQFGHGFPHSFNTIIDRYNAGHLETTWKMRLKTLPVFAQLWKTDKLLTSIDAIGIGQPPEDGKEKFDDPYSKPWLHTDQTGRRKGLHCYQGTLFLEEQCKDDWTFHVMEGSHKITDAFFDQHSDVAESSKDTGHYRFTQDELDFFKSTGCGRVVRVPVPKGGMAVWDGRLVHANARPKPNRRHPGRWRFVVFVSMTPAIWASPADIAIKKKAYNEARMTTHWSSQGIKLVPARPNPTIVEPTEVPKVAQTDIVRRLCGDLPYDFEDGRPNGPASLPTWRDLGVNLLTDD